MRGGGRSATTGQRLEPDVLRLIMAMRLRRSRDRIHPLARSLNRRVSDVALVLATDIIPISDDEHDLAGFREGACSAKDIMALYSGGAACSTSFLASSTSFVDEVYTGGAISPTSFVDEMAVVDSPATPPRSLESQVNSVIQFSTPTAVTRLLSDGSVIKASMRRGPPGFALAAFPDEWEFESEIPICMLPCVASPVLKRPASTSVVVGSKVGSTVTSTVTAATVIPTEPQKPASRVTATKLQKPASRATFIMDHYRSSGRFGARRTFPNDRKQLFTIDEFHFFKKKNIRFFFIFSIVFICFIFFQKFFLHFFRFFFFYFSFFREVPMSCGSWGMNALCACVVAKRRLSCASGCSTHRKGTVPLDIKKQFCDTIFLECH